ncbi:MAG: outer membrane protein assembly factor BamE, partial [Blastomonas sp.]|nr:outer membrane protein assembly factor BamE [Blastomonas sp.]
MISKAPKLRAPRRGTTRAALLIGLAALPLLSGCGQLRGHQGFIYDQAMASQILPGVDNRQSVER